MKKDVEPACGRLKLQCRGVISGNMVMLKKDHMQERTRGARWTVKQHGTRWQARCHAEQGLGSISNKNATVAPRQIYASVTDPETLFARESVSRQHRPQARTSRAPVGSLVPLACHALGAKTVYNKITTRWTNAMRGPSAQGMWICFDWVNWNNQKKRHKMFTLAICSD